MSDDEQIWNLLDDDNAEPSNNAPASHDPLQDDEDEQLRRAIALSQAEVSAPKRSRREETPEAEREEMAKAMAASLADAGPSETAEPSSKRRKTSGNETDDAASVSEAPTLLKIGGQMIDRAQLERERLARVAAREKSAGKDVSDFGSSTRVLSSTKPVTNIISDDIFKPSSHPQPSSKPVQGSSSTNSVSAPMGIPSALQGNPSAGTMPDGIRSTPLGAHPFHSSGPIPRDAAGEYFLDGEMRHTANRLAPVQSEPVFTPQQVMGKHSEISLVILSSYCIDDQWIEEAQILPDPGLVPTLIIRPPPQAQRDMYNGKVESIRNGEVWCYPNMKDRWGSMHMKFFWIFYKTGRLRICILTANMVSYDWDQIENTIFVQDFLPLRTSIPEELREGIPEHDLPLQFRSLFNTVRVGPGLRHLAQNHPHGASLPFTGQNDFADMKKYDWGRVKFKTLISVSDRFVGLVGVSKHGIGRLGQILKDAGWRPKVGEMVSLEYQGSSLGQYSQNWLNEFHTFASGKTLHSLAGASRPSTMPPIKVLFPSLKTVDSSVLKREGGTTMFCGKGYSKNTKDLFYDSNSKKGGVLMHSKMMIAIFEPERRSLAIPSSSSSSSSSGARKDECPREIDSEVGGWVYMGSHNFSPAAWGSLDTKKSPPSLHIRNFELGIVFPLDRKNARSAADKLAPFIRPPRKYSADDVPWDQKTHGNM